MGFWTKSKTLKSFRIFLLFIIFTVTVILFMKIKQYKPFQVEEMNTMKIYNDENWTFHYTTTPTIKNISSTNLFKNNISEKAQMDEFQEFFRNNTVKVKSKKKKSKKTTKKPIVLDPKTPEYCLRNYMLDTEELVYDPKKIFELITTKISEAYMFTTFHRMAEVLKVKIGIIEPSLLYCILSSKYKKLLIKRDFNISDFSKSENIMTFGILAEDALVLQKEENILEFRNIGLQPNFIEVPLAPWMKGNDTQFRNDKFTSHIFYSYYKWTFHIVVFYKRHNYLWHSELNIEEDTTFLPKTELLFGNHDSAYENFSFHSILSNNSNFSSIYIPSYAHFFLFQIPSSRFLECNSSRAAFVNSTNATPTSSKFNQKLLVALHELKIFFRNMLMDFWIFSGTLLGWYRECGVIPYTGDVDFGTMASQFENLDNFMRYFRDNKKLYILERMGFLEEALEFQLRCSGQRVDLFFLYEMENGTWTPGHRPSKGYYFKYYYPFFTLCSAELLEEKVQVPCETEDVILIEYGKKWMAPISSWYYESSIFNRGPNIYWSNETRPEAFHSYS